MSSKVILREKMLLKDASERIAKDTARTFRNMIEQELRDVQEQLERLKLKIKDAIDETNKIVEKAVKRELELKEEIRIELDLDLKYVASDVIDRIDELIKGFDPKFVEEMFFNLIKMRISEKFNEILKALDTALKKIKKEKQKLTNT